MSDNFENFYDGVHLKPQSTDPSNPKEGDLFISDGTPRTRGLWIYDGASWQQLIEPSVVGNLSVTTKTDNYTATNADDVILYNNTTDKTLTLFTASGNTGKEIIVKKINSAAAKVTIDGNGSETIDGNLTTVLYNQYDSVRLVSDGTNWNIIKHIENGVAYLKDVKSSGSAGGSSTTDSWATRVLNTVEGDSSIVSLSSNQFTLQPGTYDIKAICPSFNDEEHKARLQNITDTTTDIIGSSEYSSAAASYASTHSFVVGRITITAAKTFEIQHRVSNGKVTNGFGVPSGMGVSEIYTIVKIIKIK